MQSQIIGLCEKLFDADQRNAVLSRHSSRYKWIAAHQLHSESARALRHFKPDAAKAQDAQRLAAQFRALQALLLPLARVHGKVRSGQFARQGQHQPDGELGHSDRVRAWRIHHNNAAPRRRCSINVVDAYARAANHTQLGRVLHQRVVNLHGAANHKRIGIGQGRRQSFRQLIVRLHFPTRFSRKHRQSGR